MSPVSPLQSAGHSAVPAIMDRAVSLVFQTMARREALMLRYERSPGPHPAWHKLTRDRGPVVVGSIGFVGQTNGFVYLYFTEHLARQLSADIIGLTLAEVDEEGFDLVKDTIGELTNMVAGAFKNQLCNHGLACQLTIPTILHGQPFDVVEVANTSRWVIEYDSHAHRFIADVICNHVP